MTFMISIGKYGGFYIFRGFTKRICLGWIALTYIPLDDDFINTQMPSREQTLSSQN